MSNGERFESQFVSWIEGRACLELNKFSRAATTVAFSTRSRASELVMGEIGSVSSHGSRREDGTSCSGGGVYRNSLIA